MCGFQGFGDLVFQILQTAHVSLCHEGFEPVGKDGFWLRLGSGEQAPAAGGPIVVNPTAPITVGLGKIAQQLSEQTGIAAGPDKGSDESEFSIRGLIQLRGGSRIETQPSIFVELEGSPPV